MLVFLLLPITCYSEIDESDLTFIPNGRYSLYLPGYCRPGFYRMLTDLQPPSRVWPLSNFRPHWISLGRSMPCGILRSSLSFETHESKKKKSWRLGAQARCLVLTFLLVASSSRAISQASSVTCHSSGVNSRPLVVVAVTVTTMMVAGGRIGRKSTLVRSVWLPMAFTVRA